MNKSKYREILESIDVTVPEEVLNGIKVFLEKEGFAPEQKLYGIGLLLDSNKEHYITTLKEKYQSKCKELSEKDKVITELKKQIETKPAEAPKKKVVVVKKSGK